MDTSNNSSGGLSILDFLNPIGAAASTIGNIISTSQNNKANLKLAREQMAWQQAENERAFARDVGMWNAQNQYNSPAQQMKRLREAGLNPQLMYGNGSASTGNASGAPQLQPAQAITPRLAPYHVDDLGLGGIVDSMMRRKLGEQQIKMQNAQISNINADTVNKLYENDFNKEIRSYSIEAKKELLEQIKWSNKLSQQMYDYNQAKNDLNLSLGQLQIDYQELMNDAQRFTNEFNADTRHYAIAAMSLANTLQRHNISLTKNKTKEVLYNLAQIAAHTEQIGATTESIEQDTENKEYWNNIKRLLGNEKAYDGIISGLFNQFMTNFFNVFPLFP